MDISNFGTFRAGSEFPNCLDISKISGHESYGVMAQAYTYRDAKTESGYVQLRENKKIGFVALFVFGYEEQPVPESWVESEVVWDSRHAISNNLAQPDTVKAE